MVTPTASEMRKNAASEASSFSSVVRAIRPAASATTKPAISPPVAIAKRLSPEIRKPMAAPGRIACAMASPTRLIRRSIRNTPMGPAPNASASTPASARRMNSNSEKGAMRRSYMMKLRRLDAGFGLLVEGFAHVPRLRDVLRRQHIGRLAPGHRLAGKQQSFGEVRAHHVEIMQRGQHRALLVMPAAHERQQIGGGFRIDGIERFIKHDHARVLKEQPCEQHALHLPSGKRPYGALLEARQTDGLDRMLDLVALLLSDTAEQTGAAPQPHRHHVIDADRKRTVDLRDLREISDLLRQHAVALDRAGQRLDDADHALEQRRLAGAVRADHRGERARRDLAAQVMHRRMAVVAERQILKSELCVHRMAQNTTAQRIAITTTDAARRSRADRRRIDGCTVAGG